MTRRTTTALTGGALLTAAALLVTSSLALAADAPTGLTPASGTTMTTQEFTEANWNDVAGTSTPITYRYESSLSSSTNPDGSFTSPIFQSGVLTESRISTAGTPEGTYYWHVRSVENNGTMSPWSETYSVTIDNDTGTTTPPDNGDADELVDRLMELQDEFPAYYWNLQWVINDLLDDDDNGTSTPPAGTPRIDQDGMTVRAGGSIDFVGRDFGREQDVEMRLNGALVRTVHADGGGNFSTGSMSVPSTAGTYTYVFEDEDGNSASATITVQ